MTAKISVSNGSLRCYLLRSKLRYATLLFESVTKEEDIT